VGTDKRERQRAAREAKTTAEMQAARKQKTKRTGVRVVAGVAIVLALLFVYSQVAGNDDDSPETDTETDDTASEEVLARGAPDAEPPPADLPADALETETLIEGEGDGAEEGDTVTVHYIGLISDGTVFDQSWEAGEPIDVTLGEGMVITGWDEGLVGSRVGERRRLEIGSENAYGEQGAGDAIPPDAPLAFEVDIVDIQRAS
jgi:peptidylprolyl isomerase